MSVQQLMNFYLEDHQQKQAEAKEGIFGKIVEAVNTAGWQVKLQDLSTPVTGAGFHMVYNRPVTELNCLTLRHCYFKHFFRIEPTNDRWDWQVAKSDFTPRTGTNWFQKFWQQQVFSGLQIRSGGYIFMPLQGKLLERRHFQVLSPIEMIHATLAADPKRQIFATLHPREVYSQAERAALLDLPERFHLADQPSLSLLAGCDYVVTENSSLGLIGYFASKPLVLFARIDFHHIAGSVPRQGIKAAFKSVETAQHFAPYLHWFFREQAISATAENAGDQILTRLRYHGWPI